MLSRMTLTQYFVAASIDGYIADAEGKLDWLFQFDDAEGVADNYKAFLAGVGARDGRVHVRVPAGSDA
jgi:hypothetical protein